MEKVSAWRGNVSAFGMTRFKAVMDIFHSSTKSRVKCIVKFTLSEVLGSSNNIAWNEKFFVRES